MIAAIIFVISLVMLAQFFVAYCRSLLAAYAKIEVSAQACRIAGLGSGDARADEFHRLFQLVRLCPDPGDDGLELRAVHAYYGLLSALQLPFAFAPTAATWVARPRADCAHFLAVALDRRVAGNGDAIT